MTYTVTVNSYAGYSVGISTPTISFTQTSDGTYVIAQSNVSYNTSIGSTTYALTASGVGMQGDIGYTGSRGATGFTGSVGFVGSRGATGFTGSQGVIGFTGSKGDIGFTGSVGFTGSRGNTGFTGSFGATGFTGSVGFVGSQGVVGFTGSKGDLGFTGSAATNALTNTNPVVVSGTITEDVYAFGSVTGAQTLEPDNGSLQTITLSGSVTFSDGFSAGQAITLMIDDGSGFTITWPTTTWVNNTGQPPTLATTGYTVISLWKVSTVLYGALVGNGT